MGNNDRFPAVTVGGAADLIAGCKGALIVAHTNPDGDAAGSSGALKKLTFREEMSRVAI